MITVNAVYLPAKPSQEDPLGQRGYLAIKFSGGVQEAVLDGNVYAAFAKLRGDLNERIEAALLAALITPDTTAST